MCSSLGIVRAVQAQDREEHGAGHRRGARFCLRGTTVSAVEQNLVPLDPDPPRPRSDGRRRLSAVVAGAASRSRRPARARRARTTDQADKRARRRGRRRRSPPRPRRSGAEPGRRHRAALAAVEDDDPLLPHDPPPAGTARRHSRRSTNSIPALIDRRIGHASATFSSRSSCCWSRSPVRLTSISNRRGVAWWS